MAMAGVNLGLTSCSLPGEGRAGCAVPVAGMLMAGTLLLALRAVWHLIDDILMRMICNTRRIVLRIWRPWTLPDERPAGLG